MKTMTNHPGYQLRDDAADSWARFERDHGVHRIDSAYRSQATQDALKARWRAGGKFNRPPYLYEPANVSKHTSGVALDTPNAAAVAKLSAAYGWRFLFAYDVVHLEYDPAHDQHKPKPAPPKPAPAKPAPRPTAVTSAIVKAVQVKLRRDYPAYAGKLATDGINGPATKAAVREFQRRSGLTPDGIIGPKTLKRLGL